ncbi:hypothetical protein GR160_08555 [Flavobacterium sp. Sd200]|uniref:hypothetical protein n=1 Tax=Flavobacterium sp. Sd200 TaxID=2692211 RepID=UPI00136DB319|nr:hypothetical protein [Flavobacterium sp. Sd200]MXN91278.1 hypothetical protein [Flavobacterium sp. Sd200]
MKDPAFLFYPGDYLRDTQCLGEAVQVAYDRIMCEHMRNTCIAEAQLKFFTKNLSDDEIAQLKSVLTKTPDGYQIAWVAESFNKRKAYSESRRKNRSSKPKKDTLNTGNTSTSYELHMENEIEDVNENVIEFERGKEGTGEKPDAVRFAEPQSVAGSPLLGRGAGGEVLVMPFDTPEFATQWRAWKEYRATEHHFTYRSIQGEQAALAELGNLSKFTQATAIAILHQSMGKGWKGFFELKNDGAKPTATKGKVRYSDDFKRKIAQRLQSG